MRKLKVLVLHSQRASNQTLSYQTGWPEQFKINPLFSATVVNIAALGRLESLLFRFRTRVARFDAIVVLHSVFSNSCEISPRLTDNIAKLPALKVFFAGNEYKLMPEKIEFSKRLSTGLFISQCNNPPVLDYYRSELGCRAGSIPNTGVDFSLFNAETPDEKRTVDIGYRSFISPLYLGHNERTRISDYFLKHAPGHGLSLDISLKAEDRLGLREWAGFLGRCKGQIGTEAGSDYFDPEDKIRNTVNDYLEQNPTAGYEEIYERFFAGYTDPVSVRIISGRNTEAAASRTVQILFEGRYSGYFQPDVHYIPLKKDLSNFEEAIVKFKDSSVRKEIAGNAYEVARNEFTYDALLGRLHAMLLEMS